MTELHRRSTVHQHNVHLENIYFSATFYYTTTHQLKLQKKKVLIKAKKKVRIKIE